MRKTFLAVIAALSGTLAGAAQAQFAKPEQAIHYRQSVMTIMNTHAGRLGAVVKGVRPYDAAEVQANAALVETMSQLPWSAFGAGTESGAKTRAKADIWKDKGKFDEDAKALQAATVKLVAAAKSGDPGALKPAFGDVAKACKTCHDSFRED